MRASFRLLSGLIICSIAHAGAPLEKDKPLCAPAAALAAQAEFCADNAVFAREAAACLEKLDRAVADAAKGLAARYEPGAKEGASAQSQKLADSLGDYGLGVASLDALLRQNRAALEAVRGYAAALNYPVDARDSMEKPCYGENYRAVEGVRKELLGRMRKLAAARDTARKNAETSGTRAESLSGGAPAAKGVRAQAERRGPVPRPPAGGSDITGTQEGAAKRAKP